MPQPSPGGASSGSNSTTPTPTPAGLTPLSSSLSIDAVPPLTLSHSPAARTFKKGRRGQNDGSDTAAFDDDAAGGEREDGGGLEEDEVSMAASALSGMRHAVYRHPSGPAGAYRSHGGSASSSTTDSSSSSLGDRGTIRGVASGSSSPETAFKHPGPPASGKWTGETLFPPHPSQQYQLQHQPRGDARPRMPASSDSSSLAPSLASLSTAASDATPSSSSSLSVSDTTTPGSPATSVSSSTDLGVAAAGNRQISGVGRNETASGGIVFWDTVTDRPVAGPAEADVGRDRGGKPGDEAEEGVEVEVVQMDGPEGGVFLQRVGKMPLVSGVVRAYERGKGTSRVVRYGADLVESSVTSIGGRVASKVGPQRIAQMDRYGVAALDRLGYTGGDVEMSDAETTAPGDEGQHEPGHSPNQSIGGGRRPSESPVGSRDQRFSTSSESGASAMANEEGKDESAAAEEQQVSTRDTRTSPGRRRWQNMLVEAGMTAGGIGAAVSEESMKSLKYCLQWLQYANAHLDHQIALLRDFIASLHVATPASSSGHALVPHRSSQQLQTLTSIKRDVIETIRRVVDVVSKYAGGSLPEPAKAFVRKSILSLPVRWAAAIQAEAGAPGGLSNQSTREGTPATSVSLDTPIGSPGPSRMAGPGPDGYFRPRGASVSSVGSSSMHDIVPDASASTEGVQPSSSQRKATEQAAERILTFAVESLDMLRSVTAIFSESVDRADAWVERLRILGVQHRQQRSERGQVTAGPSTASGPGLASGQTVGAGAQEEERASAAAEALSSHAMSPTGSGDSLSSSQVLARSSAPVIATKRRKANGGVPKPGGGPDGTGAAGSEGGTPSGTMSPRAGGEWDGDDEEGREEEVEEELRRKRVQRSRGTV